MRRILRWSFAVWCVMSLGVSAGLWVRSYFTRDLIRTIFVPLATQDSERVLFAHTEGGAMRVEWSKIAFGNNSERDRWRKDQYKRWFTHNSLPTGVPIDQPPLAWEAGHFAVVSFHQESDPRRHPVFRRSSYGVRFPLWLPTLLLAIVNAHLIRFTLRERRRSVSPTLCKSCGYDLRAGHDKCPECGAESTVPILKHVKVEPRRL